eukprot:scaffold47090_cov43-Prasinocladus_malaysianus.AAC.3
MLDPCYHGRHGPEVQAVEGDGAHLVGQGVVDQRLQAVLQQAVRAHCTHMHEGNKEKDPILSTTAQ